MKRPVIENKPLIAQVQQYANTTCDGNFTLAVNVLLESALLEVSRKAHGKDVKQIDIDDPL